jgi:hypothetical protein
MHRRELTTIPGVRVFKSKAFREILATLLSASGIVVLGAVLVRQASLPLETGQYGVDFFAYITAAERLSDGASPYPAQHLAGPIPAQTIGQYLYPPPLAQALAPFSVGPFGTLASLWLVSQALAAGAAVWIAGSTAGLPSSRERALWTVVSCAYFLPVFDTLWKGNVSAFVALATALVAAGGTRAGFSAAAAGLVKVSPAALLAAIDRSGLRGAAMAIGLAAVSVALSPEAWRDYAVVLSNLVSGSSDNVTNLAPHVQLPLVIPGIARASGAIRTMEVAAASTLLLGALVLARRRGGVPSATVAASGAALLAPAALWLHYLVVLLPLAALAWRWCRPFERVLLVVGAGLVSAALAALPLALLGSLVMWVLALRGTLRMRAGNVATGGGC